MLGGTCEFPDDFILLRNRHLPLISCALMLETGAGHAPAFSWEAT
jgi:hypothetical protein